MHCMYQDSRAFATKKRISKFTEVCLCRCVCVCCDCSNSAVFVVVLKNEFFGMFVCGFPVFKRRICASQALKANFSHLHAL